MLLAGIIVLSCSGADSRTAILWTDRPEFAFYGEYFNASQNQYRVETRYFDYPAQELAGSTTGMVPDIVAGSWLKSTSTRAFFRPLDNFFRRNVLSKSAFYPRLLAMGNIDGRQYLLPVSFNAPVVIFAGSNGLQLSSPFTIGFDEMKNLGREYNQERGGVYTLMGFSPAWDDNFLYNTAVLFNVSFREASPLVAWDVTALNQAIDFLYRWTCEVNTNTNAEEEFSFKYLYDPPSKLVLSGRILFACINSDELFTLSEERRSGLDFRWLAEQSTIPLTENSVYMGLSKKGKAPKAANAFVHWFFHDDTQRRILEINRDNRWNETSFGIGGGFSALRPVTEDIFSRFYSGLLGHIPPENFLSPANILPSNWMTLKEQVILPYLHECARQPDLNEAESLEMRIADWLRMNG